MNATAVKPKEQLCQGVSRVDEPCDQSASNTVRDALNGSAELISLTRTGMRARPSRARVDFEAPPFSEQGIGACTAPCARILDGGAHLR